MPGTNKVGQTGSIPAYAGEPSSSIPFAMLGEVYPRVCGGTFLPLHISGGLGGLSPRMRGNQCTNAALARAGRSIPAYAGEPPPRLRPRMPSGVYPRVCGGTVEGRAVWPPLRGLSPRMRGNPALRAAQRRRGRSIPAYAGEPSSSVCRILGGGVYPRVCGGTTAQRRNHGATRGLSPRMRGNRIPRHSFAPTKGSIPAYAGEPRRTALLCRPSMVYPRVCGGTRKRRWINGWYTGLSPRMRGNPSRSPCQCAAAGSIPAYAGEPPPTTSARKSAQVYPRVCGGTTEQQKSQVADKGLSPRMRGNPVPGTNKVGQTGSIPAYAGEPLAGETFLPARRVYPRVCGGTRTPALARPLARGLSPRMRGNLAGGADQRDLSRSIPAYAGEPTRIPPRAR